MKQNNFYTLALVSFSLLVFAGCGADAGFVRVEGVITYNGAPVEGAIVTFTAADGSDGGGSGITDANGRYRLTSPGATNAGSGVVPGEYIVRVVHELRTEAAVNPHVLAHREGQITYDEMHARLASSGGSTFIHYDIEHLVPVVYSQPHTTPLRATVASGSRTHNFNLTGTGN